MIKPPVTARGNEERLSFKCPLRRVFSLLLSILLIESPSPLQKHGIGIIVVVLQELNGPLVFLPCFGIHFRIGQMDSCQMNNTACCCYTSLRWRVWLLIAAAIGNTKADIVTGETICFICFCCEPLLQLLWSCCCSNNST